MQAGRRAMDCGTDYRGQRAEDRRFGSCQSLIFLSSVFCCPSSVLRLLNGLIGRKTVLPTFAVLKVGLPEGHTPIASFWTKMKAPGRIFRQLPGSVIPALPAYTLATAASSSWPRP